MFSSIMAASFCFRPEISLYSTHNNCHFENFPNFSPPKTTSRKTAAPAIDMIHTRRIAAKSCPKLGNSVRPFSCFCSNFLNFSRKDIPLSRIKNKYRPFSPEAPSIDFSCVKELDDAIHLFHDMVRMRPQPSVLLYNKLMSLTVKMKQYSFALYVFDEMRRMGAPVDEYTLTMAINCYCHLKRVGFGFATLAIFFKCGCEPNVPTFRTLIKGLFLDDKVSDAVELFQYLLKFGICEPDDIMVSNVIDGLCKAGEIIAARDLLLKFERTGWSPSVWTYNKLMSLTVKMKQYSFSLYVFDKMRRMGAPVDEYTLTMAINCYCHLKRVDFGFATLAIFFKRGYEPDVKTFCTLIKGQFLDDKVSDAVELFKNLLKFGICEPDDIMVSTVIDGLCKAGEIIAARDLLLKFERTRWSPNVWTYNILINGLCKGGMVDDAFQLLSNMVRKGISPDVVTYNSMVHWLSGVSRWKDVEDLLHEMTRSNISFNVVTFNILIDALCNEGKVNEVVNLLKIMEQRNVCPNIVTYNALIVGYCLQGEIDKAKQVFDSIVERGLKPDIISYNSLINGYCKNGRVDEAWLLFFKVPCKGLLRVTSTYNTMIHGLCGVGRWKDVEDLLNDMTRSNISFNVVTFNILIDALCNEGKVNEAMNLLKIMEQRNVCPDIVTYNALIVGYCLQEEIDKAKQVFDSIVERGLKPDTIIYNSLINGYCKKGRVDEALLLFFEVPCKGLERDTCIYNTMIHGLFDEHRFAEGLKLFKDMEAHKVLPDLHTYSILVDGLCKNGETDEALLLLPVIKERGFNPDIVTYGALIDGLCKNGELDVARDLLKQLPSKGLQPDVRMYTTIIGSLCQEGLMAAVRSLLIEMKNCGNCAPDSVTYNVIVRGFLKKSELDKAIPFLEEMHRRGFSTDSSTSSMLIDQVEGQYEDDFLLELMKNVLPSEFVDGGDDQAQLLPDGFQGKKPPQIAGWEAIVAAMRRGQVG